MAIETTRAESYRKRADAAGKSLRTRSGPAHLALQRKQKALNEMANIEDWLDGKPKRLQNQRVALRGTFRSLKSRPMPCPTIQRVRIAVVR